VHASTRAVRGTTATEAGAPSCPPPREPGIGRARRPARAGVRDARWVGALGVSPQGVVRLRARPGRPGPGHGPLRGRVEPPGARHRVSRAQRARQPYRLRPSRRARCRRDPAGRTTSRWRPSPRHRAHHGGRTPGRGHAGRHAKRQTAPRAGAPGPRGRRQARWLLHQHPRPAWAVHGRPRDPRDRRAAPRARNRPGVRLPDLAGRILPDQRGSRRPAAAGGPTRDSGQARRADPRSLQRERLLRPAARASGARRDHDRRELRATPRPWRANCR